MVRFSTISGALCAIGLASAQCPYANPGSLSARDDSAEATTKGGSRGHMKGYELDDSSGYLTSDVGGPFSDQESLKAGDRGPTLLEDFIFRQKITHFDHERVPERAVHARGAGAYGTFTSYGDFSNITAASFLAAKEKKTPMFVRFSTVLGSRGSTDTARDIRGFATRFYTDEGNFDIVGNNAPVFFIQDAIQFPDLVHSLKPESNNEIPQASTAHNTAWDFFSQQTTSLHALFWALSGHGVPRSFRHMDGFGVHTYRLVTDKGDSKLVKWHWRSKQGLASLFQEESQHVSGKGADFHRQDLYDAIEAGNYPEWELSVQMVDEEKALAFGFDLLDPTKLLPEELAPLHPLGVMRLDANPVNYFAETEQVMFQPGHIVRGVDFSDDPLLQGRIFSYLDTQINRHGGPNFEQLPINRPIVPVHNNNRDGAGQVLIHKNAAPYSPNTLNKGYPQQADQSRGRGFFTAPRRRADGHLVRKRSQAFSDHWSQPRLFYNSLGKAEQQMLIDVLRLELSGLRTAIQTNVLAQLNKISHEIAVRVGRALGVEAPAADDAHYHDNKTAHMSAYGAKLPTIASMRVGVLVDGGSEESVREGAALRDGLKHARVFASTVGERMAPGVDRALTATDATVFDAVVVTEGAAAALFDPAARRSTLYPSGRPSRIITDSFRWGKPLGFLGRAADVIGRTGIKAGPGVYVGGDVASMVEDIKEGLATFKFLDRVALDEDE
ncbi:catalase [Cordyceps fumosorosea ARSEF 2679]|uniref:Catalase n=1 Tax=Cordyceps fumosorosea (strain ARSEF 2679) TaxID=1081104 RepID=A0A167MZ56_CORFA|nr:catalase [Cordyceps fumosorosea ARSEF 2679]OAA54933.1 catalase [Cordyceps fumosorosea ARSEF 2679]